MASRNTGKKVLLGGTLLVATLAAAAYVVLKTFDGIGDGTFDESGQDLEHEEF